MAINQAWQIWRKRLGIAAAILAISVGALLYWLNSTTAVLIIRHADKAEAPPGDPPLNAAGLARAQTLVHVAGSAGVTAIYATQFARTQQTVQPLATQLGLTATQVEASDTDGLVAQVLANHRGQTVLVAGHSDTVPQIIQKLGGGTIATISEGQFDNLFVVVIPRWFGRTKVVHLKYGVPTP